MPTVCANIRFLSRYNGDNFVLVVPPTWSSFYCLLFRVDCLKSTQLQSTYSTCLSFWPFNNRCLLNVLRFTVCRYRTWDHTKPALLFRRSVMLSCWDLCSCVVFTEFWIRSVFIGVNFCIASKVQCCGEWLSIVMFRFTADRSRFLCVWWRMWIFISFGDPQCNEDRVVWWKLYANKAVARAVCEWIIHFSGCLRAEFRPSVDVSDYHWCLTE